MQKKWIVILLTFLALLIGCSPPLSLGSKPVATTTPRPTPIATMTPSAPEPRSFGRDVAATGKVVPEQVAHLAFTLAGRVHSVDVGVGNIVQAGDPLVVLETAGLEARVASAEAEVAAAQASLDLLRTGARPEQIAAAEQAVATTRAEVAQAKSAVESAEAQHAVTQSGIESAKVALQAAQAQYRQLQAGARADEIAAAEANLEMAEAAVRHAQAAFDPVKDNPDIKMRPESLALEQATIARKAAQAQYEAVLAGVPQAARTAALSEVQAAQVQVTRAEDEALVARALVSQAQSAVEAAEARQAQAAEELSLLRAGAIEEEIAAAQAQVAQAEAMLQAARAELEQATLSAPFSGTITWVEISPGETVVSGQPVLSLADLSRLRAETTDLNELDVASVEVGQPVTIYVEALGQEVTGRVASIAPQASTSGTFVVYTVCVDMDEQVPGLLWGMSVEVEIVTE